MQVNSQHKWFLLALLLICSLSVSAQNFSANDSLSVLDSSRVCVRNIVLIGNKVTREHVVLRELTFHSADSLQLNELQKIVQRSEENLLNTSLFNSVHITWLQEGKDIRVFILMAERWYIFPLPVFELAERNFNVWWQHKDLSRVIYGGVLTWNNFRGRNEVLATALRFGYTQRVSLYYNIPYIDKKQRSGLLFSFSYARNHQAGFMTEGNKTRYFKDENQFTRNELGGAIQYIYRKGLYQTHAVEIGHREAGILDTVAMLNPDYFGSGRTTLRYTAFRYYFKSDHRDLVAYPLRGRYFDIEFSKKGFRELDDDVSTYSILSRFKEHVRLKGRFYFAGSVTAMYGGSQYLPYYLTRALGYGKEFLRGYEYYVMDGQRYILLKTNFKIQLLRPHEVYAGFVPFSKFNTIPYAFYINLYADAGYVRDRYFGDVNPLSNSWQSGYGAGIDFVTYYDIVVRAEYSFNKLGESGFFIHFTAPI